MGSKTTTKTDNNPPAWAKPAFEQAGKDALDLYKSGVGGNPYLGSTVADLSDTTMAGVNQLAQAGRGWNTAGTRPLYQGIGAAAVSDPFVSQIAGIADGVSGGQTDVSGVTAQNVGTQDFRGIYDRAQNPTAASQYLTDTASGKFLAEGNPYYRQRMESELADTASQVRSLMSGSGRYGSDVSNELLAESLGNIRLQGLENDWNRERGLQLQATGMIDAATQAALGTQLGAASGIAGINTGNADRSLQAGVARAGFSAGDLDRALSASGLQGDLLSTAAGLRGAGLDRAMGATNAMSDLDQRNFENSLAGAGATLQAGGILDNQAQKQLYDDVNLYYALDNAPWDRLSMLEAAAAGAAGPYGSQQSVSRTSNPMAAIGAASGLFGGK